MAQEFADGAALGATSDAGCVQDVHLLTISGEGHALARGNPTTSAGVPTLLTRGTGRAWGRYSKRNILRACILLLAVTGAALGTQHLIAKILRFSSSAHHQTSSNSLALRDDIQHLGVSRATANTTYRLPQIFQVGGQSAIWQVPASPSFFINWAAAISFREGDVLRFSGGSKSEDLVEVSEANYAACTSANYIGYWEWSLVSDIYLQFWDVGTSYVVSDNPTSCIDGLELAATAFLMTIPPAPPRPNVNVPSRSPQVFQVGGDTATWTVPSTTTFYEDWASNISFIVGDVLTFTLSDISFQVDQVPYVGYEMCDGRSSQWYSIQSTTYLLTAVGIIYFVADAPQYCIQGMRFTVNIYAATINTTFPPPLPPVSPSPPPPLPPVSPSPPPPPPSVPPSPPPPEPAPPISPPTSPPPRPPPPGPPSPTPIAVPVPSPASQRLGPPGSPSSSSAPGHIGVIIGSVFGGVIFIVILILVASRCRRWMLGHRTAQSAQSAQSALRIFISHTRAQKNFATALTAALETVDARGSNCRAYNVFIDRKMIKGIPFPDAILRELDRTQLAIVVVSNDYFQKKWPMIELVKCIESRPNMRILPLFISVKPDAVRDSVNRGQWEELWESWSSPKHPVDVQRYKESVVTLCSINGVEYAYADETHEDDYIKDILTFVHDLDNEMRIPLVEDTGANMSNNI